MSTSKFAAGNNAEVSVQFAGDPEVYAVKFTAESLQDESVAITSTSLEAGKKYKSDEIAVESGQSGGIEFELFDSLGTQKLIHSANGTPTKALLIKNGLVLGYQGLGNIVSVRMEGTEITINVDTVDSAVETMGKTFQEILTGLQAITGISAYFVNPLSQALTEIPAKLDLVSSSMVILDGLDTAVNIKNSFGIKGALIVETLATGGDSLLSYPGEPTTMTLQKGFTPLTESQEWGECKIGSINITVDTNAALKASLTIMGGAGKRIQTLKPITVPNNGTMFISTKQSLQFIGGIPYLAKQSTTGIANNIEKLDTFQGITQGTERTGNIDVTIGTTMRLDEEVDQDIIKTIESGVATDYLFIAWTKNALKSDDSGYAGMYIFYCQRMKSSSIPPKPASSPGIIDVQPQYSVLNPEEGEGVAIITQ